MAARVAVFIDYQNVYMRARSAFGLEGLPKNRGHVDPLVLAQRLVSGGLPNRILSEVRVYRGQPDATKDPKSYGANYRQCSRWGSMPGVKVILRPMRYPRGWPNCVERPQEKGVDVALAVDFVTLAIAGAFEVGIIVSVDTDLKPALEAVARINHNQGPRCEVAAWSAAKKGRHASRLSIPNANIWCHWLKQADFDAVADMTDYVKPR